MILNYDDILAYLYDSLPGFNIQSYDRHHLQCNLNQINITLTAFSYEIGPYQFTTNNSYSIVHHGVNFHVEGPSANGRITIAIPEWTIIINPGVRIDWHHHGHEYFSLDLITRIITMNDNIGHDDTTTVIDLI
jgi:hypothetical protein